MEITREEAKKIGQDFKPAIKVKSPFKTGGIVSYRPENMPNLAVLLFKPDYKFSKWENIDSWLKYFICLRPQEITGILNLAKAERQIQRNKFAASKDMSIRRTLILPTEIAIAIKRYYPEILSDKKQLNKLARQLRGFCVAEKI